MLKELPVPLAANPDPGVSAAVYLANNKIYILRNSPAGEPYGLGDINARIKFASRCCL